MFVALVLRHARVKEALFLLRALDSVAPVQKGLAVVQGAAEAGAEASVVVPIPLLGVVVATYIQEHHIPRAHRTAGRTLLVVA